jgi:hypothetical protein
MYDSKKDTLKHRKVFSKFFKILHKDIKKRIIKHDLSKLKEPEKPIFDKYTPKLANSTYGSNEYKEFLKAMKHALDHHYATNRHHPEHFHNGIKDMNLIDLCEMICDWKAASLRHNDGNIYDSIEINQKRFGYSDELKQIFFNTVTDYLES